MSNKVIVLWGILIILIFSSIIVIGKYYESREKYIKTDQEIKEYIKEYIKTEKIEIENFGTIEITSKELKEKEYFDKIEIDNMICEFTAYLKNYLLFNNYKIKYRCLNEIKE